MEADALAIITGWNRLRALDLAHLRQGMRGDVMMDLRNF
jgi:UDP-glucose 6-dehydrogenase